MRTFFGGFGMGALMTLSVMRIQGGVHDLLYQPIRQAARMPCDVHDDILGGGVLPARGADYEPVALNRSAA